MQFIAEITEIKERKTPSLDKEYTIKLRKDDYKIMSLSAIPADAVVLVTIEGKHD